MGSESTQPKAAHGVTSGFNWTVLCTTLVYWATSGGFPALAVLLKTLSLGVLAFDAVCGVRCAVFRHAR